MNLDEKYRPKNFKQVVGHSASVKAISDNLLSDNPNHVFGFFGDRGIGKTTIATICAKMVGATKAIITYIDCSQKSSVDDMNALVESVPYKPITGKAKVFIIDEFHNVSGKGQESLLHTLEFPPAHAFFFICTSKPNKVDKAVRDRMFQFNFQALSKKELVGLVESVAEKEEIDLDEEVLDLIVDGADGSARKALKNLGMIQGCEDAEEALEVLEKVKEDEDSGAYGLYVSLLKGEAWPKMAAKIESCRPLEAESVRRTIMAMAGNNLLKRWNANTALVLEGMKGNLYDEGFAGLILKCAEIKEAMKG